MPTVRPLRLNCHPATSCGAVRRIEVQADRRADGMLVLTFQVEADMAVVRLPPPCPPRFALELWKHTCLEAFIAAEGLSAYHEYNFAPSGEWAVYAFDRYRVPAPIVYERCAPEIIFRSEPERCKLQATIPLDRLSRTYRMAPLRLGLSAVIEAEDGLLSYWALFHPAVERPDFHHPATRIVRLAPPARE